MIKSRSLLQICALLLIAHSTACTEPSLDLIHDDLLREIMDRVDDKHDRRETSEVCPRFRSMFKDDVKFGRLICRHEYDGDFTDQFTSLLPFIRRYEYVQKEITPPRLVSIYDRLMYEAGANQNQIGKCHSMLDELVDDILTNDYLKFVLTGLYLSDENDPVKKCIIMKKRMGCATNDTFLEYLDLLKSRCYLSYSVIRYLPRFLSKDPQPVHGLLPFSVWRGASSACSVLLCGIRFSIKEGVSLNEKKSGGVKLFAESHRFSSIFPFLRGSFLDGHRHGMNPIINEIVRKSCDLHSVIQIPNVKSHLRLHHDEFKVELAKAVQKESERETIISLLA